MVATMMAQHYFIFFSFICLFNVCHGIICPPSPPASKQIDRLRETLFCDYSKLSRPVKNHSSTVNVKMRLFLNDVDMDAESQHMNLDGILEFTWKDENIGWNPADYNRISYIRVSSSEIWVPDIHTNMLALNNIDAIDLSSCIVNSGGTVTCMPHVYVRAACNLDVRHWPFDQHNCTVFLSSFLYYQNQLNLTLAFIKPEKVVQNKQWDFIEAKVGHQYWNFSSSPYPVALISVTVRRHASCFAAATVYPALASLCLILITFWMGPMLNARVTICGFVALSCATHLSYLMYLVPSNGDTIPVIMTLFRDGLWMAAFGSAIAATVKNLSVSTSTPPKWISEAADWVHQSPVGPFLLLPHSVKTSMDDETAMIEPKQRDSPYASINAILDRLSFIVSLIVFFVLLIGYLP